ncbi:hypothetical protein NUW58_g6208 [Xylaria curta]|uniref:Uncharacterized protein n=1 Tax=Xylaria curta TaxID=42375 RepID=A0ACC1NZG1_9PEZI|nr:hypothetical protein NUW58_g6208 [Xylaria curta]
MNCANYVKKNDSCFRVMPEWYRDDMDNYEIYSAMLRHIERYISNFENMTKYFYYHRGLLEWDDEAALQSIIIMVTSFIEHLREARSAVVDDERLPNLFKYHSGVVKDEEGDEDLGLDGWQKDDLEKVCPEFEAKMAALKKFRESIAQTPHTEDGKVDLFCREWKSLIQEVEAAL